MVIKLNQVILIICILLAGNFTAVAANNPFEIEIENTTLEYGKTLNINFKIRKSVDKNLPDILLPFKDSLNYNIIFLAEDSEFIKYKIKVNPVNEGELVIPSLKWKDFKSKPFTIQIIEPSSYNKQPVKVSVDYSRFNPWVREQVKILVTIISTDKSIILERKNLHTKGIESYLVPQSTTQVEYSDGSRYRHTIGWNVFFLYEQNSNLLLPEVEYLKDGVPKYKFHYPVKDFTVKSLPIYVSPVIPIGKIEIKAKYLELPNYLLQPGATSIIQYSLTGLGVPAKWLPSLSQKYNINSQRNIHYSHLKTQLNQKIKNKNLLGIKTVDIAFTPLINGFSPFTDLNLQYFDPKSGLLKTLEYKHDKLIVLNWFLQLIVFIIITYITVQIILKLKIFFSTRLSSYIYKYRCKKALHNSVTSYEIVRALQLFSISEHWPLNLSLYQWLRRFESKYFVTDEMLAAFRMLNDDMYAGQAVNMGKDNTISSIKLKITNALYNLKKNKEDNKTFTDVIYLIRRFIERIIIF